MRIASRWPFVFLSVFALARGLGCSDRDEFGDEVNFREDVILCENAVARVLECCPDLQVPGDACVFRHVGWTRDCGACSNGTESYEERVEPVLAIATSKGILGASCGDLAAADGCARLQADLSRENRWSELTGSCSDSTSRMY